MSLFQHAVRVAQRLLKRTRMKRTHALAMSVFGLLSISSFSGCGNHSPSANAANPLPLPTVTVTAAASPEPTVTVTEEPGPAPTVTFTATPGPADPQPTVTVTVTPTPQPTVTAYPIPDPLPTYTYRPGPIPTVIGPVSPVSVTSTTTQAGNTSTQTIMGSSAQGPIDLTKTTTNSGSSTFQTTSGIVPGGSVLLNSTTTTTGSETTQVLNGSVPGGSVSLTETNNGYGMTTISGITPQGSVYYNQTGNLTTCVGAGCGSLSDFYGNNAYSESGATKDVDLQQAQLQDQKLNQEADAISQQFGMNVQSARQLAQLSDRLHALGRQATNEDRAALADAALKVAGISPDEVNEAAAAMIRTGDQAPADALIQKAADNLGMASTAGLRDQILPSLGIRF